MNSYELCGAIFMSNRDTKEECLERKLFGLPYNEAKFVKSIKTGMILFLFEFETRNLYGVYRASCDGALNIVPNAYRTTNKEFPAQIRFERVWDCYPLSELYFKDAIAENYYTSKKFNFGLSEVQVHKLLVLFSLRKRKIPKFPVLLRGKSIPQLESFEPQSLTRFQNVAGPNFDVSEFSGKTAGKHLSSLGPRVPNFMGSLSEAECANCVRYPFDNFHTRGEHLSPYRVKQANLYNPGSGYAQSSVGGFGQDPIVEKHNVAAFSISDAQQPMTSLCPIDYKNSNMFSTQQRSLDCTDSPGDYIPLPAADDFESPSTRVLFPDTYFGSQRSSYSNIESYLGAPVPNIVSNACATNESYERSNMHSFGPSKDPPYVSEHVLPTTSRHISDCSAACYSNYELSMSPESLAIMAKPLLQVDIKYPRESCCPGSLQEVARDGKSDTINADGFGTQLSMHSDAHIRKSVFSRLSKPASISEGAMGYSPQKPEPANARHRRNLEGTSIKRTERNSSRTRSIDVEKVRKERNVFSRLAPSKNDHETEDELDPSLTEIVEALHRRQPKWRSAEAKHDDYPVVNESSLSKNDHERYVVCINDKSLVTERSITDDVADGRLINFKRRSSQRALVAEEVKKMGQSGAPPKRRKLLRPSFESKSSNSVKNVVTEVEILKDVDEESLKHHCPSVDGLSANIEYEETRKTVTSQLEMLINSMEESKDQTSET